MGEHTIRRKLRQNSEQVRFSLLFFFGKKAQQLAFSSGLNH